MSICPKCKASINSLTRTYTEVIRSMDVCSLKESADSRSHWLNTDAYEVMDALDSYDYEYCCPKCDYILFTTEYDAIEFLKLKDEQLISSNNWIVSFTNTVNEHYKNK